MSPNQNPDFWRSQGGPPTPPNAPKPPKDAPKVGGKPSPDGSANTGDNAPKNTPAGQPTAPKSHIENSGAGDPAAGRKDAKQPEVPSANNPPKVPGANVPGASNMAERGSSLASNIQSGGTDFINKKIDSVGSKRPDKLDDPNRSAPATGLGRDAEMGGAAVKGALGGAAKGAAKGAVTGGLHGAAVGAAKDGVLNAAERINKTEARQRADQGKSKSYRDSLIDKAGSSSSLDKSRNDMSSRFGAPTAGAAAGAGGSSMPTLTPEQMASVAKAASTVTERVVMRTVKIAGVSILLVIGLFLTMITAITSAIAPVAGASSAYAAGSATCEAPKTGGTVGGSPGNVGSEEGLKPAAVKTMRYVNSQWGGKLESIGGVRKDANAQDHATGNAIDVMIPDYKSATGKALGTEIAADLQKNADKLGITYLIWDNKFWNNSGTGNWSYSGTGQSYGQFEWAPYQTSGGGDTQLHLDHVHVSVKDQPGEALDSGTTTVSFVQPSSDLNALSFERASVSTIVPTVDNSGSTVDPASIGLNKAEQVENARTIIGMAKTVGFNKKGAYLGVTVSLVESTLINVNHGDAAGPDSTGLFQQRDWWGAREDRMNPAYAAQAFFLGVGSGVPGVKALPGWESMPTHEAAQAVQRSAYSDGSNYLKMVPLATRVVDALYDSSPPVPAVKAGAVGQPSGTVNTETSKDCTTATIGGPSTIAAGDTYPARNESYGRSESEYGVQCGDSVAGGCRGECVDWAAWKIVERTGTYGTHRVTPLGNGGSWGASASAKGIPVDMTPVAGDAIFWLPGTGGSQGAGHIGTVQKVNGDGTIVIEEYNFGGDTPATGGGRYHTRTIQASNASGYIHFFDPAKSDEENKANLISKGILVPGKGTWPRSA